MITAVNDASQVAQARRLVSAFARAAGVPEARIADVALVVTELATNLLKHAGSGQILASHRNAADGAGTDGAGLEVLALDRGAGMKDIGRCMDDGYSTAGSPGNGLGAIARLTDDLRIYSRPGLGSAIMVRFLRQPGPGRIGIGLRTELGAVLAPYPGEPVCGDNWAFRETVRGRTIVVADGAGHGVEAARAADLALRVFCEHADAPCEDLVERMHRALMPTRGAAVAVARIDEAAGTVRYCGVGNICGTLVAGAATKHMVSHNGTAGHLAPRIREFTYDFPSDYRGDSPGDRAAAPLVILHSDGITGRWDLAAYPGLVAQHPSLLAGVLLRDHRRARDDASVVAMRPASEGRA